MRALVLVAVLGMAFPAFGAEDSAPMEAAAPAASTPAAAGPAAASPEEVAPTPEPGQGEAAVEPEHAEAAPARPPVPADAVARATFATAIDHREPVDSITSLTNDQNRVYYFSELDGISGRRVTHRWEYQGNVVAEVPIAVGGPRWRAYSSKTLDPNQLGKWTVSVVDESGNVVRKDSFVYEKPAPVAETAAPAATPASPAAGEAPDQEPASPAPAQPSPTEP